MFNHSQITELKAQIKQLKKENALLRASLREIIDTAHQAINPEAQEPEKEVSHE
jgi:regulator of replication initiation timing